MRALAAVVAFMLVGNLGILAAHLWLQRSLPSPPAIEGVNNLAVVEDRLWRGAAPSEAGLRGLAEAGVVTVVDLRAEKDIHVDEDLYAELGVRRFHLPLRDGQAPSPALVARFNEIMRESPGRVFLHCGAGVGRTGTLAAAWLVATGQADPSEAVRLNLAVGPPSLEQLAFAAGLGGDEVRRPSPAITAASRLLDAPRRFWVHVRGSYTRH